MIILNMIGEISAYIDLNPAMSQLGINRHESVVTSSGGLGARGFCLLS